MCRGASGSRNGRRRESRPQDKSLSEWTGSMFEEKRALVFIGAAGIAVRAIAPFVRDKMTDPPVVAADEAGHFVSPCCQAMWGEPMSWLKEWRTGFRAYRS